jgi:hypothetical protein
LRKKSALLALFLSNPLGYGPLRMKPEASKVNIPKNLYYRAKSHSSCFNFWLKGGVFFKPAQKD